MSTIKISDRTFQGIKMYFLSFTLPFLFFKYFCPVASSPRQSRPRSCKLSKEAKQKEFSLLKLTKLVRNLKDRSLFRETLNKLSTLMMETDFSSSEIIDSGLVSSFLKYFTTEGRDLDTRHRLFLEVKHFFLIHTYFAFICLF